MSVNCGIIGLPNVGKSTLFSALTAIEAQAENYPFCTIEPNIGLVEVPDSRLEAITKIYKPQKTIRTVFEFVDIAGLVEGAARGEGLGNKFLSHIRETSLVAHVVRCFEDDNITHVEGSINPLRDIEVINTELALADLETIQKRKQRLSNEKKIKDPMRAREIAILEPLLDRIETSLDNSVPVRSLNLNEDEESLIRELHLITEKPMIYVCNVKEADVREGNDFSKQVEQYVATEGSESIRICGQLEADIAQMSVEDRSLFLGDAGLEYSALDELIRSAYHALGLRTYFTAGEKEVRAWTFKDGSLAPKTAGIIHTDFEKGFIKAEVFSCADLFELGDEHKVRLAGKLRTEGKEYLVQDGDVMHFRFNV